MMIYGVCDDYEDGFLIEDYHVDDKNLAEARRTACFFEVGAHLDFLTNFWLNFHQFW